MRGRFRLALEIRFRQSKRLDLAHLFGIDLRTASASAPPLGFPLFDLFLDARFRVDEAFSGITHKYCGFWMLPVDESGWAGGFHKGLTLTLLTGGTRATSAAGPSLHCDWIRREGQRNH